MEELKCPICGEPTYLVYGKNPRKDHLCKKHGDMRNFKQLALCEKCNEFYETDKEHTCKNQKTKSPHKEQTQDDLCVICGKSTEEGWQYLCKECYSTCIDYTREINRNYTDQEYKDYYYNAKSNIYKLTGFEKFIKPNCIKLVAIAKACDRYTGNASLLKIVKSDLKEIVFKKKEKDIIQESDEKEVVKFNNKKNQGTIRGRDGHFLDSDPEKQIDDILFTLAIPHAIHYNVPAINERVVNSDWYIPVTNTKGIYIEYFGMDKNDYIKNQDEKIELYHQHKLKLIQIRMGETSDTQRLTYEIEQQYEQLKNEILEEEKRR